MTKLLTKNKVAEIKSFGKIHSYPDLIDLCESYLELVKQFRKTKIKYYQVYSTYLPDVVVGYCTTESLHELEGHETAERISFAEWKKKTS